MKKILFTKKATHGHWVGDGFPVRTIFSYNDLAQEMSPFLLMDFAGPRQFPPSEHVRGVGEHPHRGFETVTIIYNGEVEHRDSSGGGGLIGPGDVQWMTAASGLVHEEMHSKNFTKNGGSFEVVQLWVNLRKRDKMTAPRYQDLRDNAIPRVELAEGAGFARVIAGNFQGTQGLAKTFSPVNLWDLRLNAGHTTHHKVQDGHTCALFVLSGKITVGSASLDEGSLVVLDRTGSDFAIESKTDAKVLFLGGEPLNEPVVGYGPFVMNTEDEIQQAFVDFQEGKMGRVPSTVG